jgi:hypothetical protein
MYRFVIMQELEDTDFATPYLIVDSESKAEAYCTELEKDNPGFIFWYIACEEE